jgi:hypothetical protein
VPVEGLPEFLEKRELVTQSTLSEVVQRFLVTPQLAAIALYQADYIDDDIKQEWMALTAPKLLHATHAFRVLVSRLLPPPRPTD